MLKCNVCECMWERGGGTGAQSSVVVGPDQRRSWVASPFRLFFPIHTSTSCFCPLLKFLSLAAVRSELGENCAEPGCNNLAVCVAFARFVVVWRGRQASRAEAVGDEAAISALLGRVAVSGDRLAAFSCNSSCGRWWCWCWWCRWWGWPWLSRTMPSEDTAIGKTKLEQFCWISYVGFSGLTNLKLFLNSKYFEWVWDWCKPIQNRCNRSWDNRTLKFWGGGRKE